MRCLRIYSRDHRVYLSEPWGLSSWRSVVLWGAVVVAILLFIVLMAAIG